MRPVAGYIRRSPPQPLYSALPAVWSGSRPRVAIPLENYDIETATSAGRQQRWRLPTVDTPIPPAHEPLGDKPQLILFLAVVLHIKFRGLIY